MQVVILSAWPSLSYVDKQSSPSQSLESEIFSRIKRLQVINLPAGCCEESGQADRQEGKEGKLMLIIV